MANVKVVQAISTGYSIFKFQDDCPIIFLAIVYTGIQTDGDQYSIVAVKKTATITVAYIKTETGQSYWSLDSNIQKSSKVLC